MRKLWTQEEIQKEIVKSKAVKIYNCNVMSEPGETDDYSVSDHVRAIIKHTHPDIVNYCIANTSRIPRHLYEKYKDHGLEIVGISLDTEKSTVAKYVQEAQLPWIHTFSGGGWRDATVGRYHVRAIPSVWLITRDGKVYSDNARGKLGYLVPKLIVAPEPTKKGK